MRVEVEGDGVAVKRLGLYADHLEDFSPLWPDITDAFTEREKIWFDRQGEGWAPLSPDYAARKALIHPGKPILVASGDLKDSLTGQGADLYHTDRELLLGTTEKVARFHASGTRNMPARPPLIPAQRLAAAIGHLLQRWIKYPGYGGRP